MICNFMLSGVGKQAENFAGSEVPEGRLTIARQFIAGESLSDIQAAFFYLVPQFRKTASAD